MDSFGSITQQNHILCMKLLMFQIYFLRKLVLQLSLYSETLKIQLTVSLSRLASSLATRGTVILLEKAVLSPWTHIPNKLGVPVS